ncbi:MAG: class I SAM-dependent methyltransferase [Brevinematia bacterium]
MSEERIYDKKFIHYYFDEFPEEVEWVFSNRKVESFGDFGCGDGSLIYSLNKFGYFDKVKKVVAIDISDIRLDRVKNISDKILTYKFNLNDPIPDEYKDFFDFVVCTQVIEHIENEDIAIDNLVKSLKKGGVLYLTTVYKKWYGWYFYKNSQNKWVIDPTHVREYTSDDQFLPKLESRGLKILKEEKKLFWFPITDFVLKRVGFRNDIYLKSRLARFLRKFKLPIIGYYSWNILLEKL